VEEEKEEEREEGQGREKNEKQQDRNKPTKTKRTTRRRRDRRGECGEEIMIKEERTRKMSDGKQDPTEVEGRRGKEIQCRRREGRGG
jgi:hypothetical protein